MLVEEIQGKKQKILIMETQKDLLNPLVIFSKVKKCTQKKLNKKQMKKIYSKK